MVNDHAGPAHEHAQIEHPHLGIMPVILVKLIMARSGSIGCPTTTRRKPRRSRRKTA
jgi:hypothetical protein